MEGGPLELWVVSPEGKLGTHLLGTADGDCPLFCAPRNSVFAARHTDAGEVGTLVSCITVSRFSYEGFSLVHREELAALCPAALDFYSAFAEAKRTFKGAAQEAGLKNEEDVVAMIKEMRANREAAI